MSTKNLSRTVIEGGRYAGNKSARYHSNEHFRAQTRQLCEAAQAFIDPDEIDFTPQRRKVRKGFADKLSPMYRWLKKRVGKNWNRVFSDLVATFDTRTTAGRHVVHDHLLAEVTRSLTDVNTRYWGDFYVDAQGILRLSAKNRWNRNRNRRKGIRYRDFAKWAAGRKVIVYSETSVFWMDPDRFDWVECGSRSRSTVFYTPYCMHAHRLTTKRVRVNDPDKLLAIEKTRLYREVVDGVTVYYRDQEIRQCKRGLGKYRQGARFSDDDFRTWRLLTASQREDVLYPR